MGLLTMRAGIAPDRAFQIWPGSVLIVKMFRADFGPAFSATMDTFVAIYY